MTYRAQTAAIQRACSELGHDCGVVDGLFGPKTEAGVRSWLAARGAPRVPSPGITPPVQSRFKAVVWHWSGGGHTWDDTSAEHYHFGIDGNGKVHAGEHTPEDNLNVRDNDYAAHVGGWNTGAIGVSMMGMAGASVDGRGLIHWGRAPITDTQVTAMLRQTADLCRRYGLRVSRETTLSHAEVWETHRIWQKGKWDIRCLPGWTHIKTAVETGDILRARLSALL